MQVAGDDPLLKQMLSLAQTILEQTSAPRTSDVAIPHTSGEGGGGGDGHGHGDGTLLSPCQAGWFVDPNGYNPCMIAWHELALPLTISQTLGRSPSSYVARECAMKVEAQWRAAVIEPYKHKVTINGARACVCVWGGGGGWR